MPTWLGELGMQAANTAINTGLGLLLQDQQDRRQLRQQDKLNKQQLQVDLSKMDAQQRMQLEFWNKTNIGAQVEHMKNSGINPAILYGGGPGGGASVGAGATGVSAAQAPQGGGEILGLQMLGAQKALIEAQTQKTQAEAENIAGVERELGRTQIQSLTQGIKNQQAVEALTKVQVNIAEIENDLKSDSYEDVLSTIKYAARKADKELGILTNNKEISDATKDEKIRLVEGELIGLGLANELKKADIGLTEEQTRKAAADIAQGWRSLQIQDKNAIANMLNSETARTNAQTNIREFIEKARNNAFGNEMQAAALRLEQFIRDTPESTKLTVQAATNVIGDILGIFKIGKSTSTVRKR